MTKHDDDTAALHSLSFDALNRLRAGGGDAATKKKVAAEVRRRAAEAIALKPRPEMPMLEHALALVELAGVRVFPLIPARDGVCLCRKSDAEEECDRAGKHPAVKWSKHASAEPEKIERMWRRRPDAGGIGLVTGATSGIVVLDVDGEFGAESLARLEAQHGTLPTTPTVQTRNGPHYYFAHPGYHVKTCAGELALGLDVRGDGGFVVAPPSVHKSGFVYAWVEGRELGAVALAPAPEWAFPKPVAYEPPRAAAGEHARLAGTEHDRAAAYARTVLEGECAKVANAPKTTRNNQLNKSAFAVGTCVQPGWLEYSVAFEALMSAAVGCGLGQREAKRTIDRALRDGMKKPRDLPPSRPAPHHQQRQHEASTPMDDKQDPSSSARDDAIDEMCRILEDAKAEMRRLELFPTDVAEWIQKRTQFKREPPATRLADILEPAFERMEARADKREVPITTPWADFNEQLPGGGYWPGCHVFAGGTGAGKSSWALQLALHAATNGAAVVYAGLELEDMQIALRLAGELARVGWSRLYTGQANAAQRASARDAKETLEQLSFYVDAGGANGWTVQRMHNVAHRTRRAHPEAPLLIVVDFLQLIAAAPGGVRLDLRERIGQAAYTARGIARQYDATVLLISSVGRNNYAAVSGVEALDTAGLDADVDNTIVVERFMRHPDALVGLGKESGEIEYAADSVTAAVALPRAGSKERQVVFATAKLRAGRPGWCALNFDGWRFSDDPSHGFDVYEALEKRRADKPRAKAKTNGQGDDTSNKSSDDSLFPR